MIKAAVIGGTGYAGQQLIRLLSMHPSSKPVSIGSRSYENELFSDVYGNYRNINEYCCDNLSLDELANQADVIFLALPHGLASKQISEAVLEKTRIIDLGADFRLKDPDVYEEWYQVEHFSRDLISQAVYGLPELHRNTIQRARLVANPGCYTTCSILSLAPFIKHGLIDTDTIIIDAKSGVTGAGRGMNLPNLYCECNESIKAYKVASHRHTPEIEQELGLLADKNITLTFTPHLTPMNRGILAVSYAKLTADLSEDDLLQIAEYFYRNEHFVRVYTDGKLPETRWVKGSNYCDIGLKVDERTHRLIVVAALDNLMKGAASQAVQNMNIMFGLPEKTGIDLIPEFPV